MAYSNKMLAFIKPTLFHPALTLCNRICTKQLYYEKFGEPVDVVKCATVDLAAPKGDEVLVKMISSPINPADINTIQGRYPVDVVLPAVAGSEGLAEVIEVGEGVSRLKPGSRVMFSQILQGTWRTHALIKSNALTEVPKDLGVIEGATLSVNPATAFRMLKDFAKVGPDATVIQNGANSACGQSVIQICKAWGVKTVNVVRNRPEIADLKKHLQSLGATYVLTEEELRTTSIFKSKEIPRPLLAFNCVGGKSSLELTRHLGKNGVMVTYGGMSREPVTIPTSVLIFKNLSFHGFWMSEWKENATVQEKDAMYDEIIQLMVSGQLVGPVHKLVKFDDYKEALANALSMQGFTGCKYILDFTDSS